MIIIQTPIGDLSPKSRSSTWGTAFKGSCYEWQLCCQLNRDSINHCILWFITSLYIARWAFAILTFWPSGDITFMHTQMMHCTDFHFSCRAHHIFTVYCILYTVYSCILYSRSMCCNVNVNALHFSAHHMILYTTHVTVQLYVHCNFM